MSEDLKRRIGEKQIRGGIYILCAARGPNQFQISGIRYHGNFRISTRRFLCNGEISRDESSYTGVSVFLQK